MSKKPDLMLFNTRPHTELPQESFDDFRRWVIDEGMKPSDALRSFMKQYNLTRPDASVTIGLLKTAYPGIDVGRTSLSFKIVDSAYPNSDPKQFSDDDFDAAIEELLSMPPSW